MVDSAEFPDPEERLVLEPGCRRCPALAEARECIAWGAGPTDAAVMVIGEAPGAGRPPEDADGSAAGAGPTVDRGADPTVDADDAAAESTPPVDATAKSAPPVDADADDPWRGGNWTGMAFTTRHSGRRIRTLLAEAGYAGECYYTNAVKCFPEGEDGSNREPTAEERANCRTHLETEIDRIGPDVLVPAGKHAAVSTFALAGLTLDGFVDAVLDPVESSEIDPAILPILHPSYQDVWIARLGYESEEYVAAIGDALDRLTAE